MKILLYISSIIIIIFSGLYLYQENIAPEWRSHQLTYIDMLEEKSDPETIQASYSFPVKLRQIYLPEMNRVDRCVSCHVTMEDPRFEKEENPLMAHPGEYLEKHDPEKYGCTICHDGQGRAVNWKDAAADEPDVYWTTPILRKPFLEANCYHCHVDLLKETPYYSLGKQYFETGGCLGCHKRDGKGGYLGPELRGLGDASSYIKFPVKDFNQNTFTQLNYNRNLAYIFESVRFPGAQPEETLMFDFKFSDEDARAITVYIKSLTAYPDGTQRLSQKPVSALPFIKKGQETFHLYCTACHGKKGKGGVKNPNYAKDYIPKLNTLSEIMFLYKVEDRNAVISTLETFGDLLDADPKPDFRGFFKAIAKYMSVKSIILNGHIVEKKDSDGPTPINMPTWEKSLSDDEVFSVIAYLISLYDQ
ncbi:MAG: cytochrome c [Desulfobacterales bacterium]|nr:cytochrome c [Desulfobacterales bacterium]